MTHEARDKHHTRSAELRETQLQISTIHEESYHAAPTATEQLTKRYFGHMVELAKHFK